MAGPVVYLGDLPVDPRLLDEAGAARLRELAGAAPADPLAAFEVGPTGGLVDPLEYARSLDPQGRIPPPGLPLILPVPGPAERAATPGIMQAATARGAARRAIDEALRQSDAEIAEVVTPPATVPTPDRVTVRTSPVALALPAVAEPGPAIPTPPRAGLTPGQREELRLREEAAKERKDAEEKIATEVSGVIEGAAKAQEKLDVEANRRAQFRADRIQARRQQYERLNAEFTSMEDIRHPWAGKSTGNLILGGIGVVLSELGRGLIGGENTGLRIISEAIERDLEIQKANVIKKGKQAEGALTAYRLALAEGADERQADNMARAAIWDYADRQIAALEKKAGGVLVKSQYALARAEIAKQKNAYLADNEAREDMRAQREFDARLAQEEAEAKRAEAARPEAQLPKEEQRALRTVKREYLGLKNQADRLLQIAETRWVGKDAIKAAAQWSLFKNSLIKSFMGNATEAEVARLAAAVDRDPNAIRTEAFKAQIEGIMEAARLKAEGESTPLVGEATGSDLGDVESIPGFGPPE